MKLEDFPHYPGSSQCKAEYVIQNDVTLPLSRIGVAIVPTALFVRCAVCESMFYEDGFESNIEDSIADWLSSLTRPLTQAETHFVRIAKGGPVRDAAKCEGRNAYIYSEWEKEPLDTLAIYRPVVRRPPTGAADAVSHHCSLKMTKTSLPTRLFVYFRQRVLKP